MSIALRLAGVGDLPWLRAMLYEAAHWRAGARPPIETGLATPALARLLAGWGREGDLAVVAEIGVEPVGAAWCRRWTEAEHSYGYVAPDVPELGLGVRSSQRRQGIGRALALGLLHEARLRGVQRMSLSVEADNPARTLYASLGFRTLAVVDGAHTMRVDLAPPRQVWA